MEKRYKYPRTLHLPSSPGATSDDKILTESQFSSYFCGTTVGYFEKLDGENSTLGSSYTHARSIDSRHHPSRDWLKKFHSEFSHNIPEGWRICGENMFARHSISYDNLDSYFYGFSIWDEKNICLSWKETLLWFQLLGIQPVPLVSEINHPLDSNFHKILGEKVINKGKEGFVMRDLKDFSYSQFDKKVAKYVRANHVQTDEHWMNQQVIPNKLKVLNV